jgi:hypothetical protein
MRALMVCTIELRNGVGLPYVAQGDAGGVNARIVPRAPTRAVVASGR